MTENESLVLIGRSVLLQVLKDRSFRRGHFELSAGGTSDYYIDARMTTMWGARLVGDVFCERLRHVKFSAIGGPACGAIPIVTAVCAEMAYNFKHLPEGFWVCGDAKDHGTLKSIEGSLPLVSSVVIVDDVATTGQSLLHAIETVGRCGCDVAMVLVLVDRLEGARELLHQNGIENYQSIFTVRDFKG